MNIRTCRWSLIVLDIFLLSLFSLSPALAENRFIIDSSNLKSFSSATTGCYTTPVATSRLFNKTTYKVSYDTWLYIEVKNSDGLELLAYPISFSTWLLPAVMDIQCAQLRQQTEAETMKFDIALVGMKNQLSRVKGPACEEDILVGARGESVKRADGKTVRLVNVIRSTKAVPCPR